MHENVIARRASYQESSDDGQNVGNCQAGHGGKGTVDKYGAGYFICRQGNNGSW